jgi:DNA ligase-1
MSVALTDLVATSTAVGRERGRLKKRATLASFLGPLPPQELVLAVSYLSGSLPQGKLGVGPALIREISEIEGAPHASLSLVQVNDRLDDFHRIAGGGSATRRRSELGGLFALATLEEQRFLSRLLLGEIRQGALEGVMVEAIALAYDLPTEAVHRAIMISGNLSAVVEAAATQGVSGLAAFALTVFTPLRPMLASPANDVAGTLEALGSALLEYKLDGARVQVHRDGERVRVYTRALNDVTESLPEIVRQVRSLALRRVILDGECLALREDGRPQPFQVTMRRFGRRRDAAALQDTLPLSAFYFDCLYLDDAALIDEPMSVRAEALSALVSTAGMTPRLVTDDPAVASRFFAAACGAGHEGLMAKRLDSRYLAGSRGADWLKLKSAHALDLVVLAAEWGSGRRRGWLSNLHLGARDPAGEGFVMLGKTFKGMTDRLLAWQTDALLTRRVSEVDGVVYVRPELVVEIVFNDIQASSQYGGGFALRFARVKGYREDKSAAEADTLDTVRALFQAAHKAPVDAA